LFLWQELVLKVAMEEQKEEIEDKESRLLVKDKEYQHLKTENGLLIKHHQRLKEENNIVTAKLRNVSCTQQIKRLHIMLSSHPDFMQANKKYSFNDPLPLAQNVYYKC